jgi:hypothetical protein
MQSQLDIRIKNLIYVFLQKGWEFIGPADMQSDWWFSDILQLSSTWRPVGTQLYLTLLTDPQILDEKIVWCVAISSAIPESRHYQFSDQLTLNDISRIDLQEFVANINKSILVEQ